MVHAAGGCAHIAGLQGKAVGVQSAMEGWWHPCMWKTWACLGAVLVFLFTVEEEMLREVASSLAVNLKSPKLW